jgi:hypothetical protein
VVAAAGPVGILQQILVPEAAANIVQAALPIHPVRPSPASKSGQPGRGVPPLPVMEVPALKRIGIQTLLLQSRDWRARLHQVAAQEAPAARVQLGIMGVPAVVEMSVAVPAAAVVLAALMALEGVAVELTQSVPNKVQAAAAAPVVARRQPRRVLLMELLAEQISRQPLRAAVAALQARQEAQEVVTLRGDQAVAVAEVLDQERPALAGMVALGRNGTVPTGQEVAAVVALVTVQGQAARVARVLFMVVVVVAAVLAMLGKDWVILVRRALSLSPIRHRAGRPSPKVRLFHS